MTIDPEQAIPLEQIELAVHEAASPAEVGKPGELIIHYAPKNGQAKDFVVSYNPKQMQPVVEKVKLDAPKGKSITNCSSAICWVDKS